MTVYVPYLTEAILDTLFTQRTAMCLFADKEEIGSAQYRVQSW